MRLFLNVSNLSEELVLQIYEGEQERKSILLENNTNMTFVDFELKSKVLSFRLHSCKRNESFAKAEVFPESAMLRRHIFETRAFPIIESKVINKIYKDDWSNQEKKGEEEEKNPMTGMKDVCGFQHSYGTDVKIENEKIEALYLEFVHLEKITGTATKVVAYKAEQQDRIEEFISPQFLIRLPSVDEININCSRSKKHFFHRSALLLGIVAVLGTVSILLSAKMIGIVSFGIVAVMLIGNYAYYSYARDGFSTLKKIEKISVYDYKSEFLYGYKEDEQNGNYDR